MICRNGRFSTVGMALAAVLTISFGKAALAADEMTFWDLKLGSHATDLDRHAFMDFACGTNGGPPSTPLAGWRDFARCPPEAGNGLHEVYFREDDENEFLARAHHNEAKILQSLRTTLYGEPVIMSGLFDDDGFLIGLRAVTDPRVSVEQREHAVALRNFLMARFNVDGWECHDLPREEGETDLGGDFLKEHCERPIEGARAVIEARYLRRPGQYGIDPVTRERVEGLFTSETRFELFLDAPISDREARLAAVAKRRSAPDPFAENAARALNCPGCDLGGIDLKRQNLRNANLAGANLAGANFHGANLDGANLSGANLEGANFNKATLLRANLSRVQATSAYFFSARLDGARFDGATLTDAKMSEATLLSASLSGVVATGSLDLIDARLANANLAGAEIRNSWLRGAQLNRANLSGARLITVDLAQSSLAAANLSGARIWGTDLYGADLRDANLAGADVNGCRLTAAVMTNANIEGATFEDIER